jgi:hypothetical protein
LKNKVKNRDRLKHLSYRQVTGTAIKLFGRKGKVIGETEPQILPKVGKLKREWKRKEYWTAFDLRDREHGIGRIQFQRHKRSGLFNLNFQMPGFNSTIILDERGIAQIGNFWAYAQAQLTHGHMPDFNENVIRELDQKFRAARKEYFSSFHNQQHKKRLSHRKR